MGFRGLGYALGMQRIAFLLCLMLAVGTAQAQKLYKYTLSDGKVVYSDRPPPADQVEEVILEPLQTFSLPPVKPLPGSSPAKKDQPDGYEAFTLTSPSNDSTIRDNGGNVRVSVSLSPGLRDGHSIEVSMDGKSIGSGSSTSITLTEVDRGTHTVQAAVKDDGGKVIARSNSVVFHLKRGGG